MRILGVKAALKLPEKQANQTLIPDKKEARKIVGCKEHKDIESACADQAITLVKNKEGLLPLSASKYKRVLLYPLNSGESAFGGGGEDIAGEMKKALELEEFQVSVYEPVKGFEGLENKYLDMVGQYDLLLYVSNLSTTSSQTAVRIEWAQPMGANCPNYQSVIPTMFISFANPYHLIDVPRIRTFINAYKFKPATVTAVIDKMLGRSEFKGQSPVDAFCEKWDTRL